MDRGILYLLEGTKLAPRLVVSIYSLRKFYAGPITVATGDSTAAELVARIADDSDLRISHQHIELPHRIDQHRGYILKTLVHMFTPFDVTVFIDCDTLVRGSIEELFDLPSPEHIAVTQFCDWPTDRGVVRRRILGWQAIAPELIEPALRFGRAVNTGVFAFTPRTSIFERWFEVAMMGQDRFIPDEIAMQLLLPHYPAIVLHDRFNCSPKFSNPMSPDTRIVHFHGRRHTGRYGGSWLAAYHEVTQANVAGICDWTPARDRQLRSYLKLHSMGKQ